MNWSRPGFEAVARLVGERTGLSFAPNLRSSVEQRIKQRMTERSIPDLGRYRELLEADASAFQELVAELTVGETYFFREPEQLDFIRSRVIPELVRSPSPGGGVRAWSAGCASGEEAYSLAILLKEVGLGGTATVLGTDLSHERLDRARRARYSRWSLRGVPPEVVDRYFAQRGNQYALTPEIREGVTFRQLNLADESYPSLASGVWTMDLILCRNVLIYLDRATVAGVARRLMRALSPRGWLFLGASDPPLSGLVECETVITGAGVAYRHPSRPRARAATVSEPPARPPPPEPSASVPERAKPPAPREPPARVAEPPPPLDATEVTSLYASREYARAGERARRLLERDPGDPGLWILLVRALANQGELAEAGRACTAALEHHRTSAELMYLHALLLSAAEHYGEAVAAARRALYLDRRLVVGHLVLGSVLRSLGEDEAARAALRNAERLLASAPAEGVVPASDGETARRLLATVRLQLKLLEKAE